MAGETCERARCRTRWRMERVAASAVSVLMLTTVAAHAQLESCTRFRSSDAKHASRPVRDYMLGADVRMVSVCGDGPRPTYLAESRVTREGRFCRFTTFELIMSPSLPHRLVRRASTVQNSVMLTNSACPSPDRGGYTALNNLSTDVFEHLARQWRSVTASPASFDRLIFLHPDRTVLRQLRDVISKGRGGELSILDIMEEERLGIWTVYDVQVKDPDRSDELYSVTMLRWFGFIYQTTNIGRAVY